MDSVSGWCIDHHPLLSCEYSNSYQSLLELTFTLSQSYKWFCSGATGDFETRTDETFVSTHVTAAGPVGCFCAESGRLSLSGTSGIHHRGRGGLMWAAVRRGRGRLTDGLTEWIIDSGLLTDAAPINSSKPVWWITADKQCWVSRRVFNKARWKYNSFTLAPTHTNSKTYKHTQTDKHLCLSVSLVLSTETNTFKTLQCFYLWNLNLLHFLILAHFGRIGK